MVDVVPNVWTPWSPDSQAITISTDSEEGSGEVMMVYFMDDNQYTGGVQIRFNSPIQYRIPWCRSSSFTTFPVSPPTQTDKTWRIVYYPAELRVVYYCNEVEVVEVVLSYVCTSSNWRDYWERKPTQMYFSSSASDTYCLGPLVGMYLSWSIT